MATEYYMLVDALLEFGAKYEEFGQQVVRNGNKLETRGKIRPECTVKMMTGNRNRSYKHTVYPMLANTRSNLGWNDSSFPVWENHWEDIAG